MPRRKTSETPTAHGPVFVVALFARRRRTNRLRFTVLTTGVTSAARTLYATATSVRAFTDAPTLMTILFAFTSTFAVRFGLCNDTGTFAGKNTFVFAPVNAVALVVSVRTVSFAMLRIWRTMLAVVFAILIKSPASYTDVKVVAVPLTCGEVALQETEPATFAAYSTFARGMTVISFS